MSAAVLAGLAAVFFAGLLAGGEFAVCYGVRPALRRFDAPLQIPLRQALIRRLRILVPILFFATALCGGAAAYFDRACPRIALHAAGLFVLLGFFAVTLGGTVPINKAAMAWQPAAPPPDWRLHIARWERLDIARAWLALAAFAFFLLAALQ